MSKHHPQGYSHESRRAYPAQFATLCRYWKQFVGLCVAVVAVAQAAPYLQACLKSAVGYQDNTAELKSIEADFQNHLIMHAQQQAQEAEFQKQALRRLDAIDRKLGIGDFGMAAGPTWNALPAESANLSLAAKPVN